MNHATAPAAGERDHALDACFLGPYGENDTLLEKLLLEFLRDHVYWRRNFHPEDPPAIATSAALHPDYLAFEARMRRELHQLSAALKHSVPFHSPRYLGHMVSDLLLPGLAAQMLTLPYNPNNVSEEAAPGHRGHGSAVRPAAGAHDRLPARSGPTGLRLRPPDLGRHAGQLPGPAPGAGAEGLPGGPARRRRARPGSAGRRLAGLQPARRRRSSNCWNSGRPWLEAQPPGDAAHWRRAWKRERVEQRGLVDFFAAHPTAAAPLVLAPVTAHYSWSKGMKLLGLGRHQLQLLSHPGHAPGSAMRCATRSPAAHANASRC